MSWVSDWRLDLGEKLPELEYLQIHADESPEDFDDDCWLQLCALMNRSIRYQLQFGGVADLYEDVLSYAEPEDLDPSPLIRWLAIGQMSRENDPLVDFSELNTIPPYHGFVFHRGHERLATENSFISRLCA